MLGVVFVVLVGAVLWPIAITSVCLFGLVRCATLLLVLLLFRFGGRSWLRVLAR